MTVAPASRSAQTPIDTIMSRVGQDELNAADEGAAGKFATLLQAMSVAPHKPIVASTFAESSLLGGERATAEVAVAAPSGPPSPNPDFPPPSSTIRGTAAMTQVAPQAASLAGASPPSVIPSRSVGDGILRATPGTIRPTQTAPSPASSTFSASTQRATEAEPAAQRKAARAPEGARQSVVQTAARRMQSSAVHVAISATQEGLRVIVRAGMMDAAERERLETDVQSLLGQHGVCRASLILYAADAPSTFKRRS